MTVTENLLMGAFHPPTWAERKERLVLVYELWPWLKERGGRLAPERPGPPGELPRMTLIVQAIWGGVLFGAVYGLMALGLTLVWGAVRFLNLAHGAIFTVGAYAAYWD